MGVTESQVAHKFVTKLFSFLLAMRECDSSEFQCSNRQCVHSTYQCDGDNDCGDMSDEQQCETCMCPCVLYYCKCHFVNMAKFLAIFVFDLKSLKFWSAHKLVLYIFVITTSSVQYENTKKIS